ncbi:MAG TPA: LuxR C-terminal-related transcriptional regulator [Candidatus Lustribacter sp.]|nr:LuxR C-terminal-related transcriptional regulator [Candidatus Lustribacter sp.]
MSAADGESRLELQDLERLAISAHLVGRTDDGVGAWERAHRACVQEGDATRAARCAFWLAFVLLNRGEFARGGGWVHRGQRLLDQAEIDCVEHGYLRYGASLRLVLEGDPGAAAVGFAEAAQIGDRFRSMELVALARVGHGRCLIRSGDTAGGMALLDEAMAAITTAEVSATAIGDLYCTVIEGCQEVFDVRRAQEWTEALNRWCETQPDLVLYHGQCLVHRAELMLLAGLWPAALAEAHRACARLSRPRSQPALGAAHYVRAELHRLRGELAEAENGYGQASALGREPQPGLAQLRLAQGRTGEAVTALRRAIEAAADDPATRAKLWGPMVETELAAGDVASARAASDELSSLASACDTPYLNAVSALALGSVLLAEGDIGASLAALRRAWAGWTELEAPHEAARARVLIGLAFRAMCDEESAARELSAARSALERLGAPSDLARAAEQRQAMPRVDGAGLTPRELEVMRLLATGTTNRAIAAALFISEKTVATHVSSILRKLCLPSRAAATAYAHQRRLL